VLVLCVRVRGSRRWRATVVKHLRSLFQNAEAVAAQDPALAKRYVQMARRIVMRTRVRLPADLRHRYCHRCENYFRPGENARIRLRTAGRNVSLVITCLVCGHRRKFIWDRARGKEITKTSNKAAK
jgi:ribonuclease P protein subunit RPR2